MNIGILGSGGVGQTLGAGFAAQGHAVMLASRTPTQQKVIDWVINTDGNTSAGTFDEVAAFADLAVLATGWGGTENALRLASANHLAGKIVIDATNPLDFADGWPPKLALGHSDSAGETVQRWLPDSQVVKAFNSVGLDHMVQPDFAGGPPDMFICGNSAEAKQTVSELLAAFGWGVVDSGGIEAARYIEPLAMLWILHAGDTQSRNHAFKFLRK